MQGAREEVGILVGRFIAINRVWCLEPEEIIQMWRRGWILDMWRMQPAEFSDEFDVWC